MLPNHLLSNIPIPEAFTQKAAKLLTEGEKALFAIVGDLNLAGKYAASALIVTNERLLAFDELHKDGVLILAHMQVEESKVKRMYGNAILRAKVDGKQLDILRFTYSIAELADAAALFSENVSKGESYEEEYKVVEATFDKKKSVCPNCGRMLSSQGAECINCASKGKLVKKLAVYLKPEWKLMLQNIHYVLPTYAGYLYFKAFVKSAYYLLVLSIKMKAVLHTK